MDRAEWRLGTADAGVQGTEYWFSSQDPWVGTRVGLQSSCLPELWVVCLPLLGTWRGQGTWGQGEGSASVPQHPYPGPRGQHQVQGA